MSDNPRLVGSPDRDLVSQQEHEVRYLMNTRVNVEAELRRIKNGGR